MEKSNTKPDTRINPFSMHINPAMFEKANEAEKTGTCDHACQHFTLEGRFAPFRQKQVRDGRPGLDRAFAAVCICRPDACAIFL